MILYSDKYQQNEIEYLSDEFCKAGIYQIWKKKFTSKSVSILWIVLESKTKIRQNWKEWR